MKDRNNKLFMLGVIHRDRNGSKMLAEWLDHIAPDVITLEFSNYGLSFRKQYGGQYKKKISETLDKLKKNNCQYNAEAVENLYSFADVPYEYKMSLDYVKKNDGKLFLIDQDIFSHRKLKSSTELFSMSNMEKLLCNSDSGCYEKEKAVARLFFERGVKVHAYTEEMRERDMYMRDKISMLMKSLNNKRFLHICGWRHLEDPYNLFEEFNPERAFIYDRTICV